MPEIIWWQFIAWIKRYIKYLGSAITILLIILPFGIPILLAIAFFKTFRKDK